MGMDSVMKRLEEGIDRLAEAHRLARERVHELEARVAELEAVAAASSDASERADRLNAEREATAARLEELLATIDRSLANAAGQH